MNLYIKEWPNKTATLMLDNGTVLFTFYSVDDAMTACRDWYNCNVRKEEAQGRYYEPAYTFLN